MHEQTVLVYWHNFELIVVLDSIVNINECARRCVNQNWQEEEQQEVQDVQDQVDRWLQVSRLDEATGDRMLAALYRCDAALLRAWRCNKHHSEATLLRRLQLALSK